MLPFEALLASDVAQVVFAALVPVLVVSTGLLLLYRFLTDAPVTFAAAGVGAVAGGVLWGIAAFAYSWYARTTVYYDRVYGSLSAIPIFVFWISSHG
jgi:membrane protein